MYKNVHRPQTQTHVDLQSRDYRATSDREVLHIHFSHPPCCGNGSCFLEDLFSKFNFAALRLHTSQNGHFCFCSVHLDYFVVVVFYLYQMSRNYCRKFYKSRLEVKIKYFHIVGYYLNQMSAKQLLSVCYFYEMIFVTRVKIQNFWNLKEIAVCI